MLVYLFQHRFAPLVEDGFKNQTIRPYRVREPEVGDEASLREWTGRPYRSKQRVLREPVKITSVEQIVIGTFTAVAGRPLNDEELLELALADGFESFEDMHDWFVATHGLPFCGLITKWPEPEKR